MIYLYDTDFLDLDNKNLYTDLPSIRVKKIDRLVCEQDKKLSLGAGLLLNFAIKDFCLKKGVACPSFPLEIQNGQQGKPFLRSGYPHFNLSHSGKYVLCATDENPVGIDLQLQNENQRNLTSKVMTEREINLFGDSAKNAVEIFCIKEAILKKWGVGLSEGLKAIEIRPKFHYDGELFCCHATTHPTHSKGIFYVTCDRYNPMVFEVIQNGKTTDLPLNLAYLLHLGEKYLIAQC